MKEKAKIEDLNKVSGGFGCPIRDSETEIDNEIEKPLIPKRPNIPPGGRINKHY